MNKRARSYRLHPTALEHLAVLQTLTGSTQASLIEQALAVYRVFLQEGLKAKSESVPQNVPASESPEVVPVRFKKAKPAKSAGGTSKQEALVQVQHGFGPLFDD